MFVRTLFSSLLLGAFAHGCGTAPVDLQQEALESHERTHGQAQALEGAAGAQALQGTAGSAPEGAAQAQAGDRAVAVGGRVAQLELAAAESEDAIIDYQAAEHADQLDVAPTAPAEHADQLEVTSTAPAEHANHLEVAATAPAEHAEHAQPAAEAAHEDHAEHAAVGGEIPAEELPEGDPGVPEVAIEPATEQPSRSDGVGAFRTVCDYSHMSYDDPLLYPGQPGASHLHAFFGNSDANANSTAESLRNSGNSTCRGGIANRTGYWVPAMLDGSGKPIQPNRLESYYKSGYNGIAPHEVTPFPSGLRMIAGDMYSSSAQTHAYWGCRNHYVGHAGSIPDCGPGDPVKMSVEFPQCWDGKNLDSPDHQSHMAYTQGGRCPATHPVPIPAISMNVIYDNPNGDSDQWRLSSDNYDPAQPGGFSVHADWFEAWDPEVVKVFVSNCVNKGMDCHSHLLGDGRQVFTPGRTDTNLTE